MKIKTLIAIAMASATLASCGLSGKKTVEAEFSNPIIKSSMADPSVIKADDGYFYIYGTGKMIPVWKSLDLVNWIDCGNAFTPEGAPSFLPDGGVWAPDIHYIDGKYVLYYSMSYWGGLETSGVGRAISSSPEGPFKDLGKLLDYESLGTLNCIDPCLFTDDDGVNWLFWGSFRGLFMIEMTDDGLEIKPGAEPKVVAGNKYEGVFIEKRNGFYYMFASIDKCCRGANSTYKLVVGRSATIDGPYVNEFGESMMDNKHRLLLESNETFIGPGHCSGLVTDDKGDTWILYHAFTAENNYEKRWGFLDKVVWDKDGWPSISDGTPSLTSKAPYFKKKKSRR